MINIKIGCVLAIYIAYNRFFPDIVFNFSVKFLKLSKTLCKEIIEKIDVHFKIIFLICVFLWFIYQSLNFWFKSIKLIVIIIVIIFDYIKSRVTT